MFYFRIKSDKKNNGTKISAVQHVKYINREGKFSTPEQWQEKNKFVGDFISSEKFPNAFGGQNFLLYKTDDYGSIRNTQRGIEVTQNASEETIAIALVLASHLMNHQPLIIHGSNDFKKAVLKTVEQYRQIIDAFIAKHLSEHYYAYAIHDKIGMLSGQRHPHVHIMFSERLIDDVEKIKERSANAFFLYPARKKKDGSEPSFEEKWKRGAPKDRKWCNHQYVTELRADFAQIQNAVLEKNGFSIRVDHRTLQAQKEEAEQNGDSSLARLFSRVPEKYIGVISCQDYEEPRLERLKIFRGLRERHFDLVMKLDSSTKEAEELEVKDDAQFVSSRIKSLMESKEYKSQKFVDPILADLKNKMLTAVAQVNRWKRSIISQYDAEEKAKLEYMNKFERELWKKYFETLGQKKHLEEFLQTLKKPDESDKKATHAFEKITSGIKTQIFDLDTSLSYMKKTARRYKTPS